MWRIILANSSYKTIVRACKAEKQLDMAQCTICCQAMHPDIAHHHMDIGTYMLCDEHMWHAHAADFKNMAILKL